MQRVELTGRRYGTITILGPAGVNNKGRSLWKCRCDCGNEYITTSGTLRSAVSCKRCAGLKKIKGCRFGSLVTLDHKYDEKNRHCWICRCDCGNEAVYTQKSLISGKATTCQHCMTNHFLSVNGIAIGETATRDYFLFDLKRWDDVVRRIWYKTKKGYIVSGKGDNRIVLHRLMMNAPDDVQIDHINRNKLDCRSENLRIATNAQNTANCGTYANNQSTGHKNVYALAGRYRVAIRKDGHLHHYGYYADLETAIRVANTKRKELFGEFAYSDDTYNECMIEPRQKQNTQYRYLSARH